MGRYTDLMVDLETLDNGPRSCVVSIGVAAFRLDTFSLPESTDDNTFYRRIDAANSAEHGTIGADTVLWWLKQSEEARQQLYDEDLERVALHRALYDLQLFIDEQTVGQKTVRVWGNGASFDNVILRSAYESCGLVPPWQFWNDRCYRTLKALHRDVKFERTGPHHHALWDAYSQAEHLVRIFNERGL